MPHSVFVIAAGAIAGLVLGIAIACGGDKDGTPPTLFASPEAADLAIAGSKTSEREASATASATARASATPTESPTDVPTESEPEPQPSTDDVSTGATLPCGDILVPVNKQNSLASDCWPPDLVPLPAAYNYGGDHSLRQDAASALSSMFESAAAVGVDLYVSSSFRSYDLQVSTYQYWVDTLGVDEANRISARPGHSEHQLGTTVDLTSASVEYGVVESFGSTVEGQWVANHAWEFGFVISYPAGTEGITGYAYEPWHVRYVGTDVAAQVMASGLTLHEFLLARAGG